MNPFFFFLVALGAFVIWLISSIFFSYIGDKILKLFKFIKNTIKGE